MRVSYANKPLNYLLTNVSQLCMYEWVMQYYQQYSNHRAKVLKQNFSIMFQFIQSQSPQYMHCCKRALLVTSTVHALRRLRPI